MGQVTAYTEGNTVMLRKKNIPKNKPSEAQILHRNRFNRYKSQWFQATDNIRQEWNDWAKTIVRKGVIGEIKELSGMNAFIAQQLYREKSENLEGWITIYKPPTIKGLLPDTITVTRDPLNKGSFVFTSNTEELISLIVYAGDDTPHKTNHYRGKWKPAVFNLVTLNTPTTLKLGQPAEPYKIIGNPTFEHYGIGDGEDISTVSNEIPDTLYFDVKTGDYELNKQVLFEAGGDYIGITIYLFGKELLFTGARGNDNYDAIFYSDMKPQTNYIIVVEMLVDKAVKVHIHEYGEENDIIAFHNPVFNQVEVWSEDQKWAGGNACGWGKVTSHAQGWKTNPAGNSEQNNLYVNWQGVWRYGAIFADQDLADIYEEGTPNTYKGDWNAKHWLKYQELGIASNWSEPVIINW